MTDGNDKEHSLDDIHHEIGALGARQHSFEEAINRLARSIESVAEDVKKSRMVNYAPLSIASTFIIAFVGLMAWIQNASIQSLTVQDQLQTNALTQLINSNKELLNMSVAEKIKALDERLDKDEQQLTKLENDLKDVEENKYDATAADKLDERVRYLQRRQDMSDNSTVLFEKPF